MGRHTSTVAVPQDCCPLVQPYMRANGRLFCAHCREPLTAAWHEGGQLHSIVDHTAEPREMP